MKLSESGKRMIWITAFLAVAASSFCAGHFVAEYGQRKRSDVYYVRVEDAADTPKVEAPADEKQTPVDGLRIDLNTATAEELDALDGVGQVLAERIVAYREEHGPFQYTFEIMDVSGIGNHLYDKIKEYIYVS